MAHNIMMTGVPRNIHATIATEHPYRTRQAAAGGIRFTANPDENVTCLSEKTFKFQARRHYNQIPGEIRHLGKSKFKKASLKWVKEVIPIR